MGKKIAAKYALNMLPLSEGNDCCTRCGGRYSHLTIIRKDPFAAVCNLCMDDLCEMADNN